uniref:Uncharacterized protein n=1 Tax=Anguilla anguilla TaxID=7936 RepID=A0A0E9R7B2_ANGAN
MAAITVPRTIFNKKASLLGVPEDPCQSGPVLPRVSLCALTKRGGLNGNRNRGRNKNAAPRQQKRY